jgi:hypothetical protein
MRGLWVTNAYRQGGWHWHHEVGGEVRGVAALELCVVELMASNPPALLEGLVGMIRGLANPKSRGARRKAHSQPQTRLKLEVRRGQRGGKDRGV